MSLRRLYSRVCYYATSSPYLEGEVFNVFTKVGDRVRKDDVVLEIDMAKCIIFVHTPVAGTVTEVKEKGQPIEIDDLIFSVDTNE